MYSNFTYRNPIYLEEKNGQIFGSFKAHDDIEIEEVIYHVSGQTNGDGWGLCYIFKGDKRLVDSYYPPEHSIECIDIHLNPSAVKEDGTPVFPNWINDRVLKKGEELVFQFSTLELNRPFYTRVLDNGEKDINSLAYIVRYKMVEKVNDI